MPSSATAATSRVQPPQYRSYARRWCLLWTVTLLNVANYAHWISYASVYSKGLYSFPFPPQKTTKIGPYKTPPTF